MGNSLTQIYSLKSPWVLLGVLLVMHLGAIASVVCVEINLAYKVILLVLVLTSLIYWNNFLFGKKCIIKLVKSTDNIWELTQKNGSKFNASLADERYIASFLIILRFKSSFRGEVPVIIFKTTIDSRAFLQLKKNLFFPI